MKHIVRSAFFITLGGALPLMAGVLLLIPYTDNLSTAHYGALAIYISFALLVQILMNYGVDSYLSVHYYDHNEDPVALRRFLAQVTGSLMAYGLALSAILTLLGWILFPLLFPDGNISFWPYGFMSIVTGFLNAWFRMYVNIQVFADKARKYFYFGLFNFIVTVVISTVLVYTYPETLIGPMWGRLLSGVLIFALTLGYGLREFGIRMQFDLAKEIRKYSTPIVVFSLLTWVLSYINNYILNALATPADVGIYDFAGKATIPLEYLAVGVLGAITPRVYRLWKQHGAASTLPEESRYYHTYSAINILAIAFLILTLPYIIEVFIRNEAYHASIQYIPLLCLSFIFRPLQGMLTNSIYFQKRTNVLPGQLLITAVVQILISCLMIFYFGVWGAVVSVMAAKLFQVWILYRSVRSFYLIKINAIKMFYLPIAYLAIVLGLAVSGLSQRSAGWLQLVAVVLIVLTTYRREMYLIPLLLRSKSEEK